MHSRVTSFSVGALINWLTAFTVGGTARKEIQKKSPVSDHREKDMAKIKGNEKIKYKTNLIIIMKLWEKQSSRKTAFKKKEAERLPEQNEN